MMSKMRRKERKSIVKNFRSDDEGVAAIEFALVFPVMIAIFFGMQEVKHSLQVAAKVELLSHTLSNLVASKLTDGDAKEQAALTGRDISDIIMAEQAILWPFSIGLAHVEIDEIQIRQKGAYLTWSVTLNSDAMRDCGKLNPGVNYKFSDIPAGLLKKSYAQGPAGKQATGINIITTKVKYSDDERVIGRIVTTMTDALLPVKWSYAIERNAYGPIQFKAASSAGHYGRGTYGRDASIDIAVQDCNSASPASPSSSPSPKPSTSSP